MNGFFIVGKIIRQPYTVGDKPERLEYFIDIESNRNFREPSGELKSSIYTIKLWRGIYETLLNTCHEGQYVSIRGRIENKQEKIDLIGELVSVLR